MRVRVVLVLSGLLGCAAEVSTVDGGSSEGGGAPVGSAAGGAGSGEGGAASSPPGAFDAVAACQATCSRPCVGDASICAESCLAAMTPNCEPESLSSFECSMWYCDPTCDAEQLETELLECVNPFYCGHAGNDFACEPEQAGGDCDCVGQCDDGHAGRIACSASGTCDCWFDGALVATCTEEASFGCDFQGSCCAAFMLPGGGAAAGGD